MGKEETVIGIKVRFSEYTLFYSDDFGTTCLYNIKQNIFYMTSNSLKN